MANLVQPFVCDVEWDTTDEKGKTTHHKCGSKAEDAHTYIEVEKIIAGCEQVIQQAEGLKPISDTIEYCGDTITKDALSVNGTGVEKLMTSCLENVNDQIMAIISHANNVKSRAEAVFNELQNRLNIEAKTKCVHK